MTRIRKAAFSVILFFCVGALALLAFLSATSKGPLPLAGGSPEPPLSVDASHKDFGVVNHRNTMLSHTFVLTNNTDRPMALEVVATGCNCVDVQCPPSVAPRSKAELRVDMETRSREGHFSTYVRLGTDDDAIVPIELTLHFYCEPRIYVSPPSLPFSGVARGAFLEQEVRVITPLEPNQQFAGPPEAQVSEAYVSCKYLDTSFEQATLSNTTLRRAINRFLVRIDTSAFSDEPRVSIPRAVAFQVPAEPIPKRVELDAEIVFRHHSRLIGQKSVVLSRSARAEKTIIRLWSTDKTPFTLRDASCSLPEVAVEFAPGAAPTHELALVWKPDATGSAEGASKGKMLVTAAEFPDEPYSIDLLVLP
ncbi:MAG: DUF1573 domain-containing protein [Planctomycetia bacterium]|nr:DUF1573 domain-containing protein [Planctomycetia bacterium]